MRKLCLEYKISKLEKLLMNEGKQVGTLYHICDAKAFVKYILPKDQLKTSGNYDNFLHGGDNTYISFTRNKNYTLQHDLSEFSGVFIRLVIDGDRLSDRYKIGPYNDAAFDLDTGERGSDVDDIPSYREQEEVVKGPILNLSRYIKEIQLDVASLDDDVMRAFKNVATKLKSVNVVYNNFMKRDQSPTVNKCIRATGLRDGDDLNAIVAALRQAAKANPEPLLFSRDIKKIQKAIDLGADLNYEYNRGYLLSFYCYWDMYDVVKLLIDNGADVNVGAGDDPALVHGASSCSANIVKLLLSEGADVNETDNKGNTAIIGAVRNDDAINIMRILISAGADINHKNKYGMSALKIAQRTNEDVAEFLLGEGATE